MKHLYFLQTFCYMLLCAVGFTACSSDADDVIAENGIGYVSLALNADTGFGKATKAVDESVYGNVENYTVEIWKDGKLIQGKSWLYPDVPEFIELTSGGYELKAYYGEDKPASTTGMYVEGKKTFNVNANQTTVSLTCQPVCAKVKVEFDPTMAEYFSDYSITFQTKALEDLSFVWKKGDKDPVYLKVENNETITTTYNLVKKDGKTTPLSKTYNLSPKKFLTIKVKPVTSNGNLGITIEVDDTTNDRPIDIEIPSNWK